MFARNAKYSSAILITVISVPIVLLVGVLTAFAPREAAALVLGVALVSVAFVIPQNWLMAWTLIFAALIGGSIEYFLGVAQANWIPFILAIVLAARSIFVPNPTRAPRLLLRSRTTAVFLIPAFVYLSSIAASTFLNLVPLPQILAAIKNYLMMWGILLAFMMMPNRRETIDLIWKCILFVAAFQLPVTIYQKIFVSSKLANNSSSLSYDAINGTFGGGLLGGRSGALAMFVCIAIAYALIQWRDGKWKAPALGLYLLATLPTLAIVEVKAVVFWLPVLVAIVFFTQIGNRPITFLLAVTVSFLATVGIIYIYQNNYGSPGSNDGLIEGFARRISYVFDPDRFNSATRELGRVSALVHWWRENSFSEPLQFLLGHGPGASRGVSSLIVGDAAARYSFHIDISAAAALLWDTGFVGLIAFLSMIGLGAIQAKLLINHHNCSNGLSRSFECSAIALVLIFSSVFYVRDAVDGPIIQFLMFFCLGHIFSINEHSNNTDTKYLHLNRSAGMQ